MVQVWNKERRDAVISLAYRLDIAPTTKTEILSLEWQTRRSSDRPVTRLSLVSRLSDSVMQKILVRIFEEFYTAQIPKYLQL